jgi:signal transduction histidine kinase
MSFTVLPPFWRTGWFLLLAVALAVSSAYALLRYRLAQLLRLERMRTRIAADLHDDIGSSLSRIAIQSELVRRPAALPPREVERLLLDIGESARSLVDSMSDIVWSIDPRRDDLASLAARLRQFALGILEPLDIVFDLSVPESSASVHLAPERRRHLYLILKEAIHNVAKHAACRRLEIRIRLDGGRLHVEVEDDGRGFAEPRRDGHGLRSMRSRAALLGGSLGISSVPGSGTRLELTCPIGPTQHGRALPRRTGSR